MSRQLHTAPSPAPHVPVGYLRWNAGSLYAFALERSFRRLRVARILFNSPTDAGNAECPSTVTPFNGEHNVGVQVLNTSNFPDLQGPLI